MGNLSPGPCGSGADGLGLATNPDCGRVEVLWQ